MSEEIDSLPDDPETLKAMIRELLAQLRDSRRHEAQLENKVSELLSKLFGRKSEKIDPNQLSLIDWESLGLAPVEVAEPAADLVPKPTPWRKGHGRRRPAKPIFDSAPSEVRQLKGLAERGAALAPGSLNWV